MQPDAEHDTCATFVCVSVLHVLRSPMHLAPEVNAANNPAPRSITPADNAQQRSTAPPSINAHHLATSHSTRARHQPTLQNPVATANSPKYHVPWPRPVMSEQHPVPPTPQTVPQNVKTTATNLPLPSLLLQSLRAPHAPMPGPRPKHPNPSALRTPPTLPLPNARWPPSSPPCRTPDTRFPPLTPHHVLHPALIPPFIRPLHTPCRMAISTAPLPATPSSPPAPSLSHAFPPPLALIHARPAATPVLPCSPSNSPPRFTVTPSPPAPPGLPLGAVRGVALQHQHAAAGRRAQRHHTALHLGDLGGGKRREMCRGRGRICERVVGMKGRLSGRRAAQAPDRPHRQR